MEKNKSTQGGNSQSKKLKKWQKALLSAGVAVGVILLAFLVFVIVMTAKTYHKSNTDSEEYTTAIADKTLEFLGGEDEFVSGKIESTPITLTDSQLRDFESFLESIQPEYEFSDLYNLDEPLKRYNEKNIIAVKRHKHDVRVNGEFDADYLYELVLKNNEAYLDSKDTVRNMYEVPENKKIRELCERLCTVLQEYKAAFPEIDLDTVSCNLYDLKILSPISSFANAFIDENNVFNWDEKQMEINDFVMNTDDIFTTTFYHEMVHACQICCDCYNNGKEWRVGFGNDYEDLEVNPLSWYWLSEASAEKLESNYLKVEYSTYRMYIGYLTSLSYIAQLDEKVDANMVERLNFLHDMEDVFRMFNIKTEKERLEFIKMMYTVEVLQTSPDGFYDAYKKKYNVDLHSDEDIEADFRLRLKDDALLSMTKLFYRNLARQINRGDATLQDMLYLIRVWENKLCYHCANNEYGHMVSFRRFYRDYLKLQDEFFEITAKSNDLTPKELKNGLENYRINIEDNGVKKSPNCDLTFFNTNEKQFMKDFIAEYYWTGRPSIRECVELARQCEKGMEAYNATTIESNIGEVSD